MYCMLDCLMVTKYTYSSNILKYNFEYFQLMLQPCLQNVQNAVWRYLGEISNTIPERIQKSFGYSTCKKYLLFSNMYQQKSHIDVYYWYNISCRVIFI